MDVDVETDQQSTDPCARAERAGPVSVAVNAEESTELSSASLVELATDRLRRDILAGELAPGDRIVEEQVTRRFGISRAPVREALRLLAQQGLVEHLPRRGVRVAALAQRDVDELFDLRDVLERHAVTLSAPVAEGPGLVALRAALEQMRTAAQAGGGLAMHDAHRQFHMAMVALAGHRQLLTAYEPVLLRLQMHMARNMRREAEVEEEPLRGVHRHERLLSAVETGSIEAALDALARHGSTAYLAS